MFNYTPLRFVLARKASLMSIESHTNKPQFVCPFEDIKSPDSSKITKQQLPKSNHQCNRGMFSYINIPKYSSFKDIFT